LTEIKHFLDGGGGFDMMSSIKEGLVCNRYIYKKEGRQRKKTQQQTGMKPVASNG
jgi:hypothetical protein